MQNFLVEQFSLDRIVKSPAKFDRAKLLAFNLDALQKLTSEEFEHRLTCLVQGVRSRIC